jgi:hypothetical protein
VTAVVGKHPITHQLMVAFGDLPHVLKVMASGTLNTVKNLKMKVGDIWLDVQGKINLWPVVKAMETLRGHIPFGPEFHGGHITHDVIFRSPNGAMNVRNAILTINRHPKMILELFKQKCIEVQAKVAAGESLTEDEHPFNKDPTLNDAYLKYCDIFFDVWTILNNREHGLTGDMKDGKLIEEDVFNRLKAHLLFFIQWEKDCIQRAREHIRNEWDAKERVRVASLPVVSEGPHVSTNNPTLNYLEFLKN